MNLGELFIEIGVKGNTEKLDEFDKKLKEFIFGGKEAAEKAEKLVGSLKKTAKQLALLGGALAGAYWAMDRLTQSLARQNTELLKLARTSSVALETYQKWGTIGKIVGVSGLEQQIRDLDQRIFRLKLTGEGARGFQIGGIMPTSSEDVLNQLRNRVGNMNDTAASYLLQQMGLSPELLVLLRMGREEWEKYLEVQKKYTLNKDQRKELDRMNRQLEVARIKMKYLKDSILVALLPVFLKISQALATISAGIAKVVNWVSKSNSGWAKATKLLVGFLGTFSLVMGLFLAAPAAIQAITAAFGLLKIAIRSSTLGLALLIEGLILLADDIVGYYNGKNSVYGALINSFKYPERTNKRMVQNLENDRANNNKNLGYNPFKWAYHAGNVLADRFIREPRLEAAMSSSGKTVYYQETNNQSIPISPQINIYTTESKQELDNYLLYPQQMGVGG